MQTVTFAEEDVFPAIISPVPPHDTEDQQETEETQPACAAVSPLMQRNFTSLLNEIDQDYSMLAIM